MEKLLELLVQKLQPEHLVLVVTLYGGWKLLSRLIDHGKELTTGINSISTDLKGIRVDLGAVVGKLGEHENRISRLEEK